MGHRNRDAVRVFQAAVGAPSYYEAERPDIAHRRAVEDLMKLRDDLARTTPRYERFEILYAAMARRRRIGPPATRGLPMILIGERRPFVRPLTADEPAGRFPEEGRPA